jgi:uncharacterized membrane protein (DUF485 family)
MARPVVLSHHDYERIQSDPSFVELRRRLRRFVIPVTIAFLLWYLLYVILSAFSLRQEIVNGKPKNVKTAFGEFMSTPVFGEHVNVALILGLLQFLTTFLIGFLYSRYAARRIDPLSRKLREESGEGVRA